MEISKEPEHRTVIQVRADDENELAFERTIEALLAEGGVVSIHPSQSPPMAIQFPASAGTARGGE